MRHAFALAIALASASSAFSATKDKITAAPVAPPYSGAYQPQGVDEAGLWREDDESERALSNSPLVIRDEALNAYVRKILCITVGNDRCSSARIYILRTPIFNASMSPNGTMRVFSGLLLRARSEAELGAVLGHEFGHFERRHTLQGFKAHRSATNLLSWAAVMTSMTNSRQAYQTFDNLQLSVYGNLARYGRDQEREADLLGLGYLNGGTLRPAAASRVWRNFIREAEASAASRGVSKPDFKHTAFFASHPVEGDRADYLYALAAPNTDGREEGTERYAVQLAPWLPLFLDDQIALNDFGASEFIINSLAEHGWTAFLWQARGELYRARGNPRDLMNACDFYSRAIAMDANMPLAYRGLGLSLVKTGRVGEGRQALEHYLAIKPDASDAALMGMTIASLRDK